ncbi:unnamed protein product, partial [Ascophyllum nodosum]
LANQVTSSSTAYANSSIVRQVSINSNGCTNVTIQDENSLYVADTTVFQDQDVLQENIADITSQIMTKLDQTDTSLLGSGDQTQNINTLIKNVITSTLDAEQLDVNNTSLSNFTSVTQACLYSTDTVQVYVGTRNQITKTYYDTYQTSSAVQQTSTTIADLLDAASKQTKEGGLASLLKSIAIIIILIIVFIVIVLVVLGLGALAVFLLTSL